MKDGRRSKPMKRSPAMAGRYPHRQGPALRVEHAEVADQRVQAAPVAGAQYDGLRVQPRSVDEDHLAVVEGLDGGDHLDRTVPDRVDHVHVDHRGHPVAVLRPEERALLRRGNPNSVRSPSALRRAAPAIASAIRTGMR